MWERFRRSTTAGSGFGTGLWLALAFGLVGCASTSAEEIQPRLSDQEIVKIQLDGRSRISISLCPAKEPAMIHFFPKGEGPRPGAPHQVEWVVSGLRKGQTLYIVAKEGSPDKLFGFPFEFRGKPALKIPYGYDSIVSGPVNRELIRRAFESREVLRKEEGTGHRYYSWFYDIYVTNREGEVVGRLDPEIRVKWYPPD